MEYHFSLGYSVQIDSLINSYVSILTEQSAVVPGETILAVGDGYFDVSLYTNYDPLHINTVYEYEWKLDDNTVIGSTQNLSWDVPLNTELRTSYQIQLEVSAYTNDGGANVLQYSSTAYKTFTLPELPSNITYDFTLNSITTLSEYQYSNMDIHRFLSYFPKWSSANKNFYSNASKMLSPLLERVSHSADRYDTYIENNSTDGVHFGFREYEYEIVSTSVPRLIRTEYGVCPYVGEHSSFSLESIPVRAIKEEEAFKFVKEKYTVEFLSSPIVFTYGSHLFIKDSTAALDSASQVILVGIDEDGKRIKETLLLISPTPVETINKFRAIYKVVSSGEIEIMTYLDLENDTSFSNGINLQKRITTRDGTYFDPNFNLEDNVLYILNGNSISRKDEYRFYFNQAPSKYFINNLLDVIHLRGTDLYASKLMLDYYNLGSTNSSTNNNGFIYLEDENTVIGEDLNVVVNMGKVMDEYGPASIRLAIRNGEEVKYLSSNLQLVDDKNTWLQVGNTSRQIIFSIPVTNTDPYIVELKISNRSDPLYAMGYMNNMDEYKISSNVSDIFIYNKDLWKMSTTGEYYKLSPVRLGFTSSVNRLHLFNDFNDLEFL
jgi:hypothetical protein